MEYLQTLEKKPNVLVLGNMGVGKTTLIQSCLAKEDILPPTRNITPYTADHLPVCLWDTPGFQPKQIRQWAKRTTKTGNEQTRIHIIWFCVEAGPKKQLAHTIQKLCQSTSIYHNVPILIVLTKSYSLMEERQCLQVIHEVLARHKNYKKNIQGIFPVVSKSMPINDHIQVQAKGIDALLNKTNELIPQSYQLCQEDMVRYSLVRKRLKVQALIVSTMAAGIWIQSSQALNVMELSLIKGIAAIYGLDEDANKKIFEQIIQMNVATVTAKGLVKLFKYDMKIVSAIVTGSIVAALGESSAYLFEQVYLGKGSLNNVEWVKEVLEKNVLKDVASRLGHVATLVHTDMKPKDVVALIVETFKKDPKKL